MFVSYDKTVNFENKLSKLDKNILHLYIPGGLSVWGPTHGMVSIRGKKYIYVDIGNNYYVKNLITRSLYLITYMLYDF